MTGIDYFNYLHTHSNTYKHMQVTEKLRNEIALSIPKLTLEQADKIAAKTGLSVDTVYRTLRIIRGRESGTPNEDVLLALGELAIQFQKSIRGKHKRLAKIQKQLSAKTAA